MSEPDQAAGTTGPAWFHEINYEAAAVMSFAGLVPERVTGVHDGEPVIEYRHEGSRLTFEVRLHDDGEYTEGFAHPTGDGWEAALAGSGRCRCLLGPNLLDVPADVHARDGLVRLRERGLTVRQWAAGFELGDYSPADVVDAATNLAWAVGDEER